jgi:hypothetical protein
MEPVNGAGEAQYSRAVVQQDLFHETDSEIQVEVRGWQVWYNDTQSNVEVEAS